jgi:hypothetical protein
MPRLFCPKCSSVKDVIPIEYGLPGDEMMEDGSWMIIEVKRDDKIDDPVVMAKKEFADQLAKANFMTYRVIKGTDAANSNYDALLN